MFPSNPGLASCGRTAQLHPVADREEWLESTKTGLVGALHLVDLLALDPDKAAAAADIRTSIADLLEEVDALKPV